MTRNVIGLAGAALLLAACGGGDTKTTVIEGEGGEKVEATTSKDGENQVTTFTGEQGQTATIQSGSNVKPPKDLPAYAAIYPGAAITSAMTGSDGDSQGGMLTLETSDAGDKVSDYYASLFEKQGVKTKSTMNAGTSRMITGEGPDGKAVMIAVDTSGEAGKTTVMITYGSTKN